MGDAWIGAAAALVGVLIGVGSGYLRDRAQVREQRIDHVNAMRRTTYTQFLVAAREAHYVVSGRPDQMDGASTVTEEISSETASRLLALYEELRLVAGNAVRQAAAQVVYAITSDLLVAAEGGTATAEPQGEANQARAVFQAFIARRETDERLESLRTKMRRELGIT